jgi:Cu(I)/Ag(I) efflux system protein CusF
MIPTMQELEHPVTFSTLSLSTLTRRMATLAAGLSLAVAAHAQSVEGEVKKIDLDAGKVTLKHGEIKNLDMPAMQMAFRVSDPAWLKRLTVGDKVSFTADKVNGQFTVTAIDVKK